MDSVREMQGDLAKLIFSISDPAYLSKLKETIEGYLPADRTEDSSTPSSGTPPWGEAAIDVKPITSFEEVVREQNKGPLLFADIESTIVDIEEEDGYTLEDLLAAANN